MWLKVVNLENLLFLELNQFSTLKRTKIGNILNKEKLMPIIKETPENIAELLKQASLKDDYKARLVALKELKKYDCPQSRDMILRLALHDKVFKVKQEAFKVAKSLDIKKNGKALKLGKKNIGYKLEDFIKIFSKIKETKEMDELDLNLFKKTLKSLDSEMYDVIRSEKGDKFNSWVKTSYNCLPKNKL